MARIVMADDGIPFDGRTPDEAPLGGAETAFVSLANAFAHRGHIVHALTNGGRVMRHAGVDWDVLSHGVPKEVDLYIANRGDRLLKLVPRAKTTAFWVHNPASYLLKWRYLSKLWHRRPVVVFLGQSHAATYPRWAPPRRRAVVPHGVDDVFRTVDIASVPPPRAVFTSNALRGLDWVLDLWATQVRPRVPAAELHVFSAVSTYGAVGAAKADLMTPVLNRARSLTAAGVVLRKPLPKPQLAAELAASRAFLYPGTADETFCFAAAEAQAVGVPAVVGSIGAMPERVRDGISGFVVAGRPQPNAVEFAARVVQILTDDALWCRLHDGAVAHQRARGWLDVAADFEGLCHA